MPLHDDGKTVRCLPRKQGVWQAYIRDVDYRIYLVGTKVFIFRDGTILDAQEFLESINEEKGLRVELEEEFGDNVLMKVDMQAVMEQV